MATASSSYATTWVPGTYQVEVTLNGARVDGYELRRKTAAAALDHAEEHVRFLVSSGMWPAGLYKLKAGAEVRTVSFSKGGGDHATGA